MKPHYTDDRVTLYHGDCIEVMRTLPDASVDAIVTDPPYLLDFMGKGWDAANGIAGKPEVWREALRVLKPGGHLLAFGGTRTWHRLASAIEDAGFEVRDSIAWMYGSGFPKSLDVSKAIDKKRDDRDDVLRVTGEIARLRDRSGLTNRNLDDAFGFAGMAGHWTSVKSQPTVPTVDQWAVLRDMLNPDEWLEAEVWRLNGRKGTPGEAWDEREVVGSKTSGIANKDEGQRYTIGASKSVQVDITAPATPAAKQWQGWGTALKPAFEPIVVARKPLIGTVAANVLTHGTGALNIDGCRIAGEPDRSSGWSKSGSKAGENTAMSGPNYARDPKPDNTAGRWPANVILDESQAAELDKQSGDTTSVKSVRLRAGALIGNGHTHGRFVASQDNIGGFDDTGGASRFFYTAKANSSERPNVDGVAHPTVKPLDLMRYLVRLVTPPGGTVLEPFAGSGTTAEACIIEGFKCIAIEMTDEYLPLILDRITKPIETVMF
jgi:SAM-dependent methyltransferase